MHQQTSVARTDSRQRPGAVDRRTSSESVDHALRLVSICNRYLEPYNIDGELVVPELFYAQEGALLAACNLLKQYFYEAAQHGGAESTASP